MNRLGLQRRRGRPRIRLTLEHLESRRLMAGLNVLVFNDQDGSRSLGRTADSPASNRVVFIDSNQSGRFDASDRFAASGLDGIASFADLEPGNYWIGLAGANLAQRQTTAVISDSSASVVAQTAAQSLIASADMKQAWAVSASGRVTPLGSDEAVSEPFELGGSVVSSTKSAFGAGQPAAWALIDTGSSQPTLVRLDMAAGRTQMVALEGVPEGYRAVGVARMGDELVLQLHSPQDSRVGLVAIGQDSVSITHHIAIPEGKLVGTSVANQLAVIGTGTTPSVSTVRIAGSAATIQTVSSGRALQNAELSQDGKYLFAVRAGGGLEVFSVADGLRSAAYLAEAAGPVAISGRDGRVVTASATGAGELIVWDPAAAWQPVSRIALPPQSGAVSALATDSYGDKVLATTASAVLSAALAKPSLMHVHVAADQPATAASLGVRLVGEPAPLPELVEIALSVAEDDLLALDLSAYPALAVLGSAPLIWQTSDRPQLGSLTIAQSGQLAYKPAANANGKDSARLTVYNGISRSTVQVSLNVTPVNDLPDAFTVDPAALAEASPAGTGAGYATVFDVDADARYVISTSDPRFYVASGQLLLSGAEELDFETEPVVQLTVTATDADNPHVVLTKQVAIPVIDSNDGPTAISASVAAVPENVSGAAVGQVQVTDPDGHGEYYFSVSDTRFEIVDGQLRLRDGQELNYEWEQRVVLTLSVHDPSAEINAAPVSTTVVVDVLDRNDAPAELLVSAVDVKEHDPGAYAGSVDVHDEDFLDQYTFSVSDARFIVQGDSLRLKDGQALDSSEGAVLPVVVTATDGGGKAVSTTVSINIINESPFQNPDNPFDVDNDGEVYPRDVLILINLINQAGPHVIQPLSGTGEGDNPMQGLYVDVNGDGALTALDVLILINCLNQNSTAAMSDSVDDSPWSPPVQGPTGGVSTDNSQPLDSQSSTVDDSSSDSEVDSESEMPHSLPVGEGEGFCVRLDERAEIDAELETLLEELSRERLR